MGDEPRSEAEADFREMLVVWRRKGYQALLGDPRLALGTAVVN